MEVARVVSVEELVYNSGVNTALVMEYVST